MNYFFIIFVLVNLSSFAKDTSPFDLCINGFDVTENRDECINALSIGVDVEKINDIVNMKVDETTKIETLRVVKKDVIQRDYVYGVAPDDVNLMIQCAAFALDGDQTHECAQKMQIYNIDQSVLASCAANYDNSYSQMRCVDAHIISRRIRNLNPVEY